LCREDAATPAACAWRYCARPISDPSSQTMELFDMFWLLKGATRMPARDHARHSPVTTRDLPASELVPVTSNPATAGSLCAAETAVPGSCRP